MPVQQAPAYSTVRADAYFFSSDVHMVLADAPLSANNQRRIEVCHEHM
jgi:hypothetical protein